MENKSSFAITLLTMILNAVGISVSFADDTASQFIPNSDMNNSKAKNVLEVIVPTNQKGELQYFLQLGKPIEDFSLFERERLFLFIGKTKPKIALKGEEYP